MSNPPYFWSMALNTSKLRWPELHSDFKPNGMEIGMPSSESFENSNAALHRSRTVSATLSRKPPKSGSKHLPPGSMLQTKHDRRDCTNYFLPWFSVLYFHPGRLPHKSTNLVARVDDP
jgi:hypothetical protein